MGLDSGLPGPANPFSSGLGSFMDPQSTAVLAGASILGGALQGKPASSSADSVFSTNLNFDNSGWNVAFPSATVSSTSDKAASQGGAGGLSGNLSTYLPYALIFVGALVAWRMTKKS